jgi:hypothetical protein
VVRHRLGRGIVTPQGEVVSEELEGLEHPPSGPDRF